MRVVFLGTDAAWSGRARAFAAAARGLAERGHLVTVICPPDSPHEHHLERTSYEVLPLDLARPWARAVWRLRRALEERMTDVVFVPTAGDQLLASAAARVAGRPAVLRRLAAGEPPAAAAPAVALRLATTGFLHTSDTALREAPAPRRARLQGVAVPLGVDVAAYDAVRAAAPAALDLGAGGCRLVACVYAPGNRLRAAVALRVVALLAPRHPELRLVVLGAGSADPELQMHAAALRLTPIAAFLGPRADALGILRAATLGWVAADGDDAAYGCLDLMALRVPVLAARSPVTATYVAEGIAGLLFGGTSAAEIAAEVTRLLARPEERQAMGDAARARVARDFTEEAMVAGFERAALAAAGEPAQW